MHGFEVKFLAASPDIEIELATQFSLKEDIVCFSLECSDSINQFDILFCPETCLLPDNLTVVSVAICHSIPDEPNGNFRYTGLFRNRPNIARQFDYIIVPSKPKDDEIYARDFESFTSKIYPSDIIKYRSPSVCIIKGGYPKVDYWSKHFFAENRLNNTIVYAPTNSRQRYSNMLSLGKDFLLKLSKELPHFRIVVRPYPGDLECVNLFQSLDVGNILFDYTASGFHYLKDAAFMVTDRSSLAFSFSLSAKRPVVFLKENDDKKVNIPNDIGIDIYNIATSINDIGHYITGDGSNKFDYDGFGNRFLYKYLESSTYIASILPVMASRNIDPEFISVPREPTHLMTINDINCHITKLNEMWPRKTKHQDFELNKIITALSKKITE
ncbi:hypothetical protein [Rheinheimera maricola]|uniref:CDP-Glycerol:Poly(Glycerophosphate) glycerophosphotransferase n=1 Tax=Rheinheimera maricola TaxID=2793282 RepID=A0ABS7X6H8_9GAMM|nr:hypothetical protein [Rheinheimera maricola]MBZ9610318.1 hypothetical protein [Rheinheimera maricola]